MDKKKIALLSNVTVDLIGAKLRKEYDLYIPEGYDTWIQEVINTSSDLYQDKIDAVILLIDGTEARDWDGVADASDKIALWKQAVSALVDNTSSVPIFISTIDVRENRIKAYSERKYAYDIENDWYQFIQSLSENKKNVFVFDLKDTITDIGRNAFYSDKMYYLSSMPYSREGLGAVVEDIKRMLDSVFSARKKIIVLDLDNTLWGGVIGEDGIEGIELSNHKEGERFYDFQRQILEMKNRGVVLAVNSKNNTDEALNAMEKHPNMLLRPDDFVSLKINWNDKASNIKEISSELNLTEGSFIFIDDNPIERSIVSGECPDVTVPDFPQDTTTLRSFAEEVYFRYCRPLRLLDEDLKKTQMYKNEAKRKQELSNSLDLDEYISKLEICVDIHKMRPEEQERVVQLCNKTNQFNVTTKRYTASDIKRMSDDDGADIYVVYSKDKYGDNGLISVLIVKYHNDHAEIDTFLMSCRVMGRKLENIIMNELIKSFPEHIEKIIASYIPTAKNAPVKDLFDRLGFKPVSENEGSKNYELFSDDFEKCDESIYKEIIFE